MVEEQPPVHVPEPEVPVSDPLMEESAVRQSGRVKSKPDLLGFPPKVQHITVKKGFRQCRDTAHSSIMTELQQLVDKYIFTTVEAWKLLPEQMQKAITFSHPYCMPPQGL